MELRKRYVFRALSYDEVNSLYDNADVFVFTSLRDTSGNVVLEAMSHGLPVIAINHHGVGEIVTDETGIRIDPVSYDSVKAIWQKLLKSMQKSRPNETAWIGWEKTVGNVLFMGK